MLSLALARVITAAVYHSMAFSSTFLIIFIFPNSLCGQGIHHSRIQKDCLRGLFGDVRGLAYFVLKCRQFPQRIHHVDRININV